MAIDQQQWDMIVDAGGRGQALSAGFPDLLIEADLPARDAPELNKLHGWYKPIPDSREAFRSIGYDLTVIDRAKYEGSEVVADLNEIQVLGEYDLVVDPGTSEHCFNVAQALLNLAGAVKEGGVISQALPMSMFNHGYWNVNPVALLDFYELNGFEVEQFLIRGIEPLDRKDLRKRLRGLPDGAVNLILARRIRKKRLEFPQQ